MTGPQMTLEEVVRRQLDREKRATHYQVFDDAKAKGACFHCATECGFAATDDQPRAPNIEHKTCRRRLGIQ